MKRIKLGSLCFWGSWFFIVWLTNVMNVLKVWDFLPADWMFFSGNWELIHSLFVQQHFPIKLAGCLFGIIIFWEFCIVVMFFHAFYVFWKEKVNAIDVISKTFGVALAFWGAFLLGDECLIAYSEEAKHIILACLIFINATFFYFKDSKFTLI